MNHGALVVAILRPPNPCSAACGTEASVRSILTSRYLAVFAPAGMDDFFAEVGKPVAYSATVPAPQGPPDMERFMGICQKHGVVFAGPPPA